APRAVVRGRDRAGADHRAGAHGRSVRAAHRRLPRRRAGRERRRDHGPAEPLAPKAVAAAARARRAARRDGRGLRGALARAGGGAVGRQGHRASAPAGRDRPGGTMTARELVPAHRSPLWLVDLDRVRRRVREFRAAWERHVPDVEVAYSYKTNRLPAILLAVADEGAAPEVVGHAEYLLARDVVGAPGDTIVVNGPAKPDRLRERAGEDGALVVVDDAAELRRAAAAGVRRVGVRVRTPGVGEEPSRFGIPPADVPDAVRAARALGLAVELLGAHTVATGFRGGVAPERSLASAVTVAWPPSGPERHVAAARALAELARATGVEAVD